MKNVFVVLLVLVTIGAVGAAAYFYGKTQGMTAIPSNRAVNYASPSGSPMASVAEIPVASGAPNNMGTVSGKLCYPASVLPAGAIVARNTKTGQVYNQNYQGSEAGGSLTYTYTLPLGTYHIKYDAQGPSGILSGYYTSYSSCVDNPSGADCSGQKTRANLDVVLTAGAEVDSVNLCDFYYPTGAAPAF